MKLLSTNPSQNYALVGEVEVSTLNEIQDKVSLAAAAKGSWRDAGLSRRVEFIRLIRDEFEKRHDEISNLICAEVGKPIQHSRNEAKYYTRELDWFMDNAPAALCDEITFEDKRSIHKITYEPFGVVAVISPWNYPFGMAMWGIIPNLLAGNTVVFKASEECPLMGKLIEEVLRHHLPNGVFNEVYGPGEVGEQLSEGDIDMIWFTGSSKTGKRLYKTAADKFIKAILEMGGSNPSIIFDDVDIASAASVVYGDRFSNCGQVCSATKRLIVHKDIKDDLLKSLAAELSSKKVGDPMEDTTDIGSLVAKRQLDLLEAQVKDALDKGATIAVQSKLSDNLKGAYFPPTILENTSKDMRVWKEEVFGPVLPVVTFGNEEEAIEMANDTIYGLGSRVMSRDLIRAQRVASKLEAGTVEINEGDRWLTCNPFGGYKSSGMGREHGILGLREVSQVKVISSSK